MTNGCKCDVLWMQYPNTDYYPPGINGLRILANNGFAVQMLCREDRPATGVSYCDRVAVTRINGKVCGGLGAPLEFLRFLGSAFRLAIRRRPKVLYGADLHGFVAAGIVGETLAIPYIYHCYDLYLPGEGIGMFAKKLKPLERLFSRRAKCLIFPSQSKAQAFLKTSRLDRSYVVVANSAMKQPQRRTDSLRTIIRQRGASPRQVVLYQGSIGPGTGVDTIVRSVAGWPAGAVLALLGVVKPIGYMDRLMDTAEKMGIGERVFYLGEVNHDDLLDLTRSADLGLFLPVSSRSNYITSGTAINKVMEYMACGLPSLVASFPTMKALMEETGAGATVDPHNPKAIARAVTEMLTDQNKWKQYSQNARKVHLQKYNFEHQFEPVLQTLCQLKSA